MGKPPRRSLKKRLLVTVIVGGALLAAAYILFEGIHRSGMQPADVRREATEALDAAKDYATEKREALQRSMAAEADELQKELNELESRAARSTQDFAKQTTQDMERLLTKELEAIETRIQDLRAKLTQMSNDTRVALEARILEMEDQKKALLDKLKALKGKQDVQP